MPEVLTQTAPARVESAGKAMITSAQIARRVHALGRQISHRYSDIDTPLVLVVILKGATVFALPTCCAASAFLPSSSSFAPRATDRAQRAVPCGSRT